MLKQLAPNNQCANGWEAYRRSADKYGTPNKLQLRAPHSPINQFVPPPTNKHRLGLGAGAHRSITVPAVVALRHSVRVA
jgi:hypothetical protein